MSFLIIMMLGTLISISSFSWINIWIGLEMNLLAFIPIISSEKLKHSSEASLKYFLVQVSASMMILFSFLYSFHIYNSLEKFDYLSNLIFNCSILMKMGMVPFHFWYIEVIEGLNWINILIMMTWQKITPMIMLMYNFNMNYFFCMIIMLSMLISGLKSWNQTSMKKIMALSSINHMGWMLGLMFINQSLWMFYFFIYTLISTNFIMMMNKFNIYNISELSNLMNLNKSTKFFFFFNLMSLGGIPPFMGFLPKWLVLKILMENNFYLMAFFMVFLTLLSLYIYMRLIIQSLTFKISEKKNIFKNFNSFFFYFINFINIMGIIIFTTIFNIY
uniref:NADH-ubiquinone oxidoreductase chain 2 n=1 Tax=Eriopis connexa TaxID=1981044 RepID=A0A343YVE8_9CUCU|nr:NADH dehydrogenase subunit 2 [Eriopis connexa]